MQHDKKPGSTHFDGAKIDQVNIGDVSNNHHHNYHTPPGSITFNFLGQPLAPEITPEVGHLLSAYSKPRNEHGFPASQPLILGQDGPLTTEQRRTLNDKVKLLESQFGQSGKAIWQNLHRTMGTANINEMAQRHFSPADAILDKLHQIAILEEQIAHQDLKQQTTHQQISQLQEQNQSLTRELETLRKTRATPAPCPSCRAARAKLAETRQRIAYILSVSIASIAAFAYLGLQN